MRLITSLVQAVFCLLTMSSLAAAWPTFVEEWHLVVRQNDDNGTSPDPLSPRSLPSQY